MKPHSLRAAAVAFALPAHRRSVPLHTAVAAAAASKIKYYVNLACAQVLGLRTLLAAADVAAAVFCLGSA